VERGERLQAVEARAEQFTAGSMVALALAAKDTAQELVNTWHAFGHFCRTRVGVGPETVLQAWGFPVAGDFEQTLKRYEKLKPQKQKVKQYAGYICKYWDQCFGKGSAGDEGDEVDEAGEGGDGDVG
jgi:hypothetical protein